MPSVAPSAMRRFLHATRPVRDHYTVLGVHYDASSAEIRSAFLRLAKTTHPDANADDPGADVPDLDAMELGGGGEARGVVELLHSRDPHGKRAHRA